MSYCYEDCLSSVSVWATCHKRKYYSARNDGGNSGNPSVRGKPRRVLGYRVLKPIVFRELREFPLTNLFVTCPFFCLSNDTFGEIPVAYIVP